MELIHHSYHISSSPNAIRCVWVASSTPTIARVALPDQVISHACTVQAQSMETGSFFFFFFFFYLFKCACFIFSLSQAGRREMSYKGICVY